jgi:pyruvate carboxylase
MPPTDFEAVRKDLESKIRRKASEIDLLSYMMYPKVFLDFDEHRKHYSDTSLLPTKPFFYGMKPGDEITAELEQGKNIILKFLATGEPDPDGVREVFFELNGQPRVARTRDLSLKASANVHRKADPGQPGHVAAPMPGKISAISVKVGDKVTARQKLMNIEAMKMETSVYAGIDGKIASIEVTVGSTIKPQDLLAVIEPA